MLKKVRLSGREEFQYYVAGKEEDLEKEFVKSGPSCT